MPLRKVIGILLVLAGLLIAFTPAYTRFKQTLASAGMAGSTTGIVALVLIALLLVAGAWLLFSGGARPSGTGPRSPA